MINYDPKDAVMLFPAGDYPAVLHGVEEKQSKAGNDMYELSFDVYNGERQMNVKEYVVFPTFVWKLKKLARALGKEDEFEAGDFDPRKYVDKSVTVTLEIKQQDGYDDKNTIKAYMPRNGGAPVAKSDDPGPDDDDLPF